MKRSLTVNIVRHCWLPVVAMSSAREADEKYEMASGVPVEAVSVKMYTGRTFLGRRLKPFCQRHKSQASRTAGCVCCVSARS